MNQILKKLRSDASGLLGSLILAVFACISIWRWSRTGSIFFLLLAMRECILAIYFARRAPAKVKESGKEAALAYISTFLPLTYISPSASSFFQFVASSVLYCGGFLIATLAAIELGERIGIAPAVRANKCNSGIYRTIRHPMYVGYMIAEFGWVTLNAANAGLYLLSCGLYVFRMKRENALLEVI